jgi:hypothetical protein
MEPSATRPLGDVLPELEVKSFFPPLRYGPPQTVTAGPTGLQGGATVYELRTPPQRPQLRLPSATAPVGTAPAETPTERAPETARERPDAGPTDALPPETADATADAPPAASPGSPPPAVPEASRTGSSPAGPQAEAALERAGAVVEEASGLGGRQGAEEAGPATPALAGYGDDAGSRRTLAELVRRDLVGVAADAAAAIESVGGRWIVSADVLRAVAAARAPQRVYGPDAERFNGLVQTAIAAVSDDLEAVMLLGGLLRPAILQHPPTYRARLAQLAQGRLGQHLLEAAEAIAELDYEFPPSANELARIAGGTQAPQNARIARRLGAWCDTTVLRKSRWQFATTFMHEVASPDGLIGAARTAIEAERRDAAELARRAIDRLKGPAMIMARSQEFAAEIGRPGDHLYPKGVDYLDRHFSEAIGYLSEWVQASDPGRAGAGRSGTRLRSMVGTLDSRLEKAGRQLRAEAPAERPDEEGREAAVAGWLAARGTEARMALAGDDANSIAVLDEALTGSAICCRPTCARDCATGRVTGLNNRRRSRPGSSPC